MQASILTGALLFFAITISAQDSIATSTDSIIIDSVLLVKNDIVNTKPVFIDTTFIVSDTTTMEDKTDTTKVIRSPKKAGLYSAIIPGLGQAYNHKYWKIPIIYIGGGILVNACIWYNDRYNKYLKLCNEEIFSSSENSEKAQIYANGRDFYRRYRDRYVLFTGLLYIANVVDAIVDAYFYDFDISDDLSLKVTPVVTYPEYALGPVSFGMTLSLTF